MIFSRDISFGWFGLFLGAAILKEWVNQCSSSVLPIVGQHGCFILLNACVARAIAPKFEIIEHSTMDKKSMSSTEHC